jgi:hypothetical protein
VLCGKGRGPGLKPRPIVSLYTIEPCVYIYVRGFKYARDQSLYILYAIYILHLLYHNTMHAWLCICAGFLTHMPTDLHTTRSAGLVPMVITSLTTTLPSRRSHAPCAQVPRRLGAGGALNHPTVCTGARLRTGLSFSA